MQKHIVKHGSVFYFRMAVPKDLKGHYPHREIKRSLKTSDKEAAHILGSSIEARVQRDFAILRSQNISLPSPRVHIEDTTPVATTAPTPLPSLTPTEAQPEALCMKEAVKQFKEEK